MSAKWHIYSMNVLLIEQLQYLYDLILIIKLFLYVFFSDVCVIRYTDTECVSWDFITPLLHL